MLRDRYEPMNLFASIPTLGMRMDPVLSQMDTLLDDDVLLQAVKADLVQRFPATATDGRPSTPVEVILRMLIVKHLYGWSFPQTAHAVSDSLVLRPFCRVYVAPRAGPESIASVGTAPPACHAASPAGPSCPPGLSAHGHPGPQAASGRDGRRHEYPPPDRQPPAV